MLALALQTEALFGRAMTSRARKAQNPQAIAMGQALMRLRKQANMTQSDAAEAAGVEQATWQRYEAGDRPIILREDVAQNLAKAVGATYEQLIDERDNLRYLPGVSQSRTAAFERPVTPPPRTTTHELHLNTDALAPWGYPGERIVYDRGRYPRRDMGCVVEMKDAAAELVVGLYQRSDTTNYYVLTSLDPKEVATIARAGVAGIYAVTSRGD